MRTGDIMDIPYVINRQFILRVRVIMQLRENQNS